MPEARGGSTNLAAAILFVAIGAFIGVDLVLDYGSGTDPLHLVVEFTILSLAAAGAVWLVVRFLRLRESSRALQRDLESARDEARRWRGESRELLEGFGAAIDRQFERWQLTPAESEVGLLLLKGLSQKEIAGVRGTSERTVKQQAKAVYLKAGLAGRSELSAFFLEDILLPRD